jgi:hypothetical protein
MCLVFVVTATCSKSLAVRSDMSCARFFGIAPHTLQFRLSFLNRSPRVVLRIVLVVFTVVSDGCVPGAA